MRNILVAMALCAVSTGAFAGNWWVHKDGDWWADKSPEYKIAYVEGLANSTELGAEVMHGACVDEKAIPHSTECPSALVTGYFRQSLIYLDAQDPADIVAAMNSYYANPANKKILAVRIYWWVVSGAQGRGPTEATIQSWRKLSE